MRRREFIIGLSGAAVWPLGAQAQQRGKVWRIGVLAGGFRPASWHSSPYSGFPEGMRELGYFEGRDFAVEWRFAEGKLERFPEIGAEFVRLNLDMIVSGVGAAVPHLQKATTAIPIVMVYSIDPVGSGDVGSLARPGGNTTGLSSALADIMPKQIDLLLMMVRNLSRIGVLLNPNNSTFPVVLASIQEAANKAGITVLPAEARNPQEVEGAFDRMAEARAEAVIVAVDPFFLTQRQRIAELAVGAKLPSMFGNREYTAAGGLMSYGESLREFYRRSAFYVDKIIKGAKPADLPVEQPTKFELVINLKIANALGLAVPPTLLARADEVIE